MSSVTSEHIRVRVVTLEVTFLKVQYLIVNIFFYFQHPTKTSEVIPNRKTISCHILDTSIGLAAANIDITVYRLNESEWKSITKTTTNSDGRCSQIVNIEQFLTGLYKLSFDVKPYFERKGIKSFYPYIEIVIECVAEEHYHIPLLLSPFGYTTYRGT